MSKIFNSLPNELQLSCFKFEVSWNFLGWAEKPFHKETIYPPPFFLVSKLVLRVSTEKTTVLCTLKYTA